MRKARERRIEIIRRRLLRKSTPRIQVTLILTLTALAGFLTSFCLLHSGVHSMWLRYPLAILMAYGVFLVLLGVWLWLQPNRGSVSNSRHTVLFYIYVDDVKAMHAELGAKGMPVGAITTAFYAPDGEFELVDPDGYVLMITHV
jgi:hypothetical protein